MRILLSRAACSSVAVVVLAVLSVATLLGQPVVETVFYDMPDNLLPVVIPAPTADLLDVPGYPDDPERMTLVARLYRPDPAVFGPGPYPVVIFLHGSGGLWANNNTLPNAANLTVTNSPSSQFREWGNVLVTLGYACLFPDSLHPRGVSGSYAGRKPHHDPAQDDSLCSPNYERPKDVVAAIEFLGTLPDIDRDRLGLIGFSHGAQTGMNVLVDASVDLGIYQVDYVDLVPKPGDPNVLIEETVDKEVPSPVRIPAGLPVPKFCAFYYGGGGHYGYHGSPSSVAAGRYMLDRRTTAILFHGSDDYLLGVSDHDTDPIEGTLYPMKQVLASAAQAASLGRPNPIIRHYILNRTEVHAPASARVTHSFDLGSVGFAAEVDWDTSAENPNQKARRLARDEVLRWLDFKLQPSPALAVVPDEEDPVNAVASWPTRTRLSYRLEWSETLAEENWSMAVAWTAGTGNPAGHERLVPESGRLFFRLHYRPVAAPVDQPEHEGFFLSYADFGL